MVTTAICQAGERSAEGAELLVAEYLNDVEGWRDCLAHAPQLAWCATAPEVVGVCYGRPSPGPDEVVLQGIAVEYSLQRKGIASRLLCAFEASVAAHGGRRVSLGSGTGGEERFYLHHGYEPVGYLFTYPHLVALDRFTGLPVTRFRPGSDRTMVNVTNPDGYQPDVREHLRQRYGAAEVNYIFAKTLR